MRGVRSLSLVAVLSLATTPLFAQAQAVDKILSWFNLRSYLQLYPMQKFAVAVANDEGMQFTYERGFNFSEEKVLIARLVVTDCGLNNNISRT